VRTYARSVLSSVADVELRFSSIGSPWRWAVPIAIAVAALWYAARRLAHQDVA
jgi:hypothetical protein